ncbi:MAG TPA: 2-hydroxychromene-2-carboxylate isomerase [Acidocella sp.]|jgi:2-hydroxychromene-2-carboxylate isomerase|uniref:2-hydroxychromene-2-carboxylate isomerase n=1 Tax=Acidocella sp. TaxID=50710 RepID=UPI002C95094D|nr:2-hydroxychromene-2-carboxylate isomerase [Acidocella sp.]HVE21555.1 2-hydroxychromene-2-carboxylate isomerase [Acidocella sp.]
MQRKVEYFLSMASPWAYLGHDAFRSLSQRHGVEVVVRPIPLRRLFPETGGLPLPKRHPVRQKYRLVELTRWRDLRNVPLKLFPAYSPFDATLLDGVVTAAVISGYDPDAFMRKAFAGIWHEERNLADPSVIIELAVAAGLPASLLDRDHQEAAQLAYEANLQDAIDSGVFGAPSYVLDDEIFWGQDRLELLDIALSTRRAAVIPEVPILQ